MKTVTVPREVLIRALTKARLLYMGIAAQHGHDAGPDDECWAEFERLAEYVRDDGRADRGRRESGKRS